MMSSASRKWTLLTAMVARSDIERQPEEEGIADELYEEQSQGVLNDTLEGKREGRGGKEWARG